VLVSAFRLLHNLFENVLDGEAGAPERYTITLHEPQEIFPGAIDAGDILQVHRDGAPRVSGARHIPTIFEFGYKGAGQPAFHYQNYVIAGLLDFDFHHRVNSIGGMHAPDHR